MKILFPLSFLVACSDASSPAEKNNDTATTEDTAMDTTENTEPIIAVINEISAASTTEDWIEFYNPSMAGNIDIAAWEISDNNTELFSIATLSDDTIVPAGGFLVVYTKITDENGNSIGFGIKKDGSESLFLLQNDEEEEIVIPPAEADDLSYGRYPDGSNSWENGLAPTPGSFNE